MLPVVDKPAIQYVVEEAVAAGMTDVLMVTGRGKRPLEDHFDSAYELENVLERKGDTDKLAKVRESTELATVHYVRQGEAKGLGHAVLCARDHVGDHPFAVLLGDDLIDERDRLLPRMAEVQQKHGGSVIALLEVPREQIHLYGCVAVETTEDDDVVRVTDLVEKPSADEAPSTLAIIGRYVMDAKVFDVLDKTPPGRGDEIQLTDALQAMVKSGEPVHGLVFSGRRYDTGDRGDYLKAVVRLACERDDLGPDFLSWLRDFVADR